MRDVYSTFFKHYRLLPDEVGRQNPWILFKMLDNVSSSPDKPENGNEYIKMFYGM